MTVQMTGKTRSVFMRYDIASESDLDEAAMKLNAADRDSDNTGTIGRSGHYSAHERERRNRFTPRQLAHLTGP
jgi:hypothetical protein